MPTVRKITRAEVEPRRRQTARQYDGLVEALAAGDGIELVLEAGESSNTARRMFTGAVRRRGLNLTYIFDSGRIFALICEQE